MLPLDTNFNKGPTSSSPDQSNKSSASTATQRVANFKTPGSKQQNTESVRVPPSNDESMNHQIDPLSRLPFDFDKWVKDRSQIVSQFKDTSLLLKKSTDNAKANLSTDHLNVIKNFNDFTVINSIKQQLETKKKDPQCSPEQKKQIVELETQITIQISTRVDLLSKLFISHIKKIKNQTNQLNDELSDPTIPITKKHLVSFSDFIPIQDLINATQDSSKLKLVDVQNAVDREKLKRIENIITSLKQKNHTPAELGLNESTTPSVSNKNSIVIEMRSELTSHYSNRGFFDKRMVENLLKDLTQLCYASFQASFDDLNTSGDHYFDDIDQEQTDLNKEYSAALTESEPHVIRELKYRQTILDKMKFSRLEKVVHGLILLVKKDVEQKKILLNDNFIEQIYRRFKELEGSDISNQSKIYEMLDQLDEISLSRLSLSSSQICEEGRTDLFLDFKEEEKKLSSMVKNHEASFPESVIRASTIVLKSEDVLRKQKRINYLKFDRIERIVCLVKSDSLIISPQMCENLLQEMKMLPSMGFFKNIRLKSLMETIQEKAKELSLLIEEQSVQPNFFQDIVSNYLSFVSQYEFFLERRDTQKGLVNLSLNRPNEINPNQILDFTDVDLEKERLNDILRGKTTVSKSEKSTLPDRIKILQTIEVRRIELAFNVVEQEFVDFDITQLDSLFNRTQNLLTEMKGKEDKKLLNHIQQLGHQLQIYKNIRQQLSTLKEEGVKSDDLTTIFKNIDKQLSHITPDRFAKINGVSVKFYFVHSLIKAVFADTLQLSQSVAINFKEDLARLKSDFEKAITDKKNKLERLLSQQPLPKEQIDFLNLELHQLEGELHQFRSLIDDLSNISMILGDYSDDTQRFLNQIEKNYPLTIPRGNVSHKIDYSDLINFSFFNQAQANLDEFKRKGNPEQQPFIVKKQRELNETRFNCIQRYYAAFKGGVANLPHNISRAQLVSNLLKELSKIKLTLDRSSLTINSLMEELRNDSSQRWFRWGLKR